MLLTDLEAMFTYNKLVGGIPICSISVAGMDDNLE